MEAPAGFFVYGTLKRGELRESAWPHAPLAIAEATVRGQLYDLGPYPALAEGTELVLGEFWSFRPEDMQATLATLDRIEGFDQTPHDLYQRRVVSCELPDQSTVLAWTYFYARLERLATASRIEPDAAGLCRWVSRRASRRRR